MKEIKPVYYEIRPLREGELVHRTMDWIGGLLFDLDAEGGLIGIEDLADLAKIDLVTLICEWYEWRAGHLPDCGPPVSDVTHD